MPITSLLIVPSIQGTIPAYLMAFASLALVLPSRENAWFESQRARYLSAALLVAGIWLLLFCGSQLAHIISDRHDFGDLSLIRDEDRRILLRPALFTQTLYLSACICTALFFRFLSGRVDAICVLGRLVPRSLRNLRVALLLSF
jgi:hypothetical protein